ncbi:MAG TPA: class I SAM-dependent methyltransferase [Candidatus Dormibacteraeota bacterium]|nr:class I SAM-dependent methyltransferase [Candidatus Dormibacteraeota bacterium]
MSSGPSPDPQRGFVPALGYHWLTRLYDPLVALTVRERALKRQLVRQADLQPGQAVLDFGCGTGTLAILLKQACPGARVVGLDVDPTILAEARRKIHAAGLDIELRQAFLTADTFPPGSFDRVLSTLVLHHLTHDERAATLAVMRTLLRPGGELHVADFGAPRTRYARLVSHVFSHFDGTERTADNLAGRLAAQVAAAGFAAVAVVDHRDTLFGTVDYLRAQVAATG